MVIDNLLDQFNGLDKPEQKTKIEVVGNPSQIFGNLLFVFASMTKERVSPNGYRLTEHDLDFLLEEANKLILPYESLIPDTIGEKLIRRLTDSCDMDYMLNGIFFSAMLNAGNKERRLIIPDVPNMFCGYKNKRGIIESHGEFGLQDELGSNGKGGCIFNGGYCPYIGAFATGGLFVNYDTTHAFGMYSSNAFFINRGRVIHQFGTMCNGGLFINFNESISDFGLNTKSGIYIEAKSMTMGYAERVNGINLYTKKLSDDKKLVRLLEELKESTTHLVSDKSGVDNINLLARRIDEHCKQWL